MKSQGGEPSGIAELAAILHGTNIPHAKGAVKREWKNMLESIRMWYPKKNQERLAQQTPAAPGGVAPVEPVIAPVAPPRLSVPQPTPAVPVQAPLNTPSDLNPPAPNQRQQLLQQGVNEALGMLGMSDQRNAQGVLANYTNRSPQWTVGDNYISNFMLTRGLTQNEALQLRDMWENRKKQFVQNINTFSYPQQSGEGVGKNYEEQRQMVNDLLSQAQQIHQENSYWNAQRTPGGYQANAPQASSGWDFIRKQINSNPNLTRDSRIRLQREFASLAEQGLYGQRASDLNPYAPAMSPADTMKPKNQQLAREYFQTQDPRKLTVDQRSELQNFQNRYTPPQQRRMLDMARDQRVEQRQVQQTNSAEYQDFTSRIQELSNPAYESDAQDKVALADEINASYMTPQQKQQLLKQLR